MLIEKVIKLTIPFSLIKDFMMLSTSLTLQLWNVLLMLQFGSRKYFWLHNLPISQLWAFCTHAARFIIQEMSDGSVLFLISAHDTASSSEPALIFPCRLNWPVHLIHTGYIRIFLFLFIQLFAFMSASSLDCSLLEDGSELLTLYYL